MQIKLPKMNPEVVKGEIVKFIQDKVSTMNKSGIIVGVSGGVDSAITALLCQEAMAVEGKTMIAYILPGNDLSENDTDNDDARNLCKKFNIPYEILNLKSIIDITEIKINPHGIGRRVKGNMASRIRSCVLHTYAEINNCLVCGTGNKDEDFGIGYYTLFGDGAVHISPIGGLSKRLVYEMAKYLGVPDSIISKPPSARLEDDQTDFGDLGYGYDLVELVSEGISQGYYEIEIGRYLDYHFNIIYDFKKFETIQQAILDISKRHHIALKKAQLVSPEIAKVTLIYE